MAFRYVSKSFSKTLFLVVDTFSKVSYKIVDTTLYIKSVLENLLRRLELSYKLVTTAFVLIFGPINQVLHVGN